AHQLAQEPTQRKGFSLFRRTRGREDSNPRLLVLEISVSPTDDALESQASEQIRAVGTHLGTRARQLDGVTNYRFSDPVSCRLARVWLGLELGDPRAPVCPGGARIAAKEMRMLLGVPEI